MARINPEEFARVWREAMEPDLRKAIDKFYTDHPEVLKKWQETWGRGLDNERHAPHSDITGI